MNAQHIAAVAATLGLLACAAEFPEPTQQIVTLPDFEVDQRAPAVEDAVVVDAAIDAEVDMCGPTELCNGVDDDCDGEIDEGFFLGEGCAVGEGVCRAAGETVCDPTGGTMCSADPGPPTTEQCDGLDNDCNGLVDDGLGVGEACTKTDQLDPTCETQGITRCVPGEQTPLFCDAPEPDPDGDGVGCAADCAPDDPARNPRASEICNLLDDDCDGEVDEGLGEECDCFEIVGEPHRYLACQSGRTWQNAADQCAQYRSRIAVFDNPDEEFWLLATLFLKVGVIDSWWIGLHRDDQGNYRWVDDQAPFDGWALGQPDSFGRQSCVASSGVSYTWVDYDCQQRFGVICEDACEGGDLDGDGDGFFRCTGDCDDTESQVHPGAPEQCGNHRDDNCNGEVDEDCD